MSTWVLTDLRSKRSWDIGRLAVDAFTWPAAAPLRQLGDVANVLAAVEEAESDFPVITPMWLILDKTIYPLDVDAAEAFSLLDDGLPDDVEATAGYDDSHLTTSDGFGYSTFVTYNSDEMGMYRAFLAEANDLCATPLSVS